MVLDKLTILLDIQNKDKEITKLELILDDVTAQILLYINEPVIPAQLEWVLVNATKKAYNMLNSEHLVSEGVDVISSSFKQGDLLDEFKEYLDLYIASYKDKDDKKASLKKVRIL